MSNIDTLIENLNKSINICKSIEDENKNLKNENKYLKNALSVLKNVILKNESVPKNYVNKILYPIEEKYDFTNAPYFLKVLKNIESLEEIERYMLQLGCFATNTRTIHQVVITGPSPSGKTTLCKIAELMNSNINSINPATLLYENKNQTRPLFCKKETIIGKNRITIGYDIQPFWMNLEDKTIEDVNKCLEKTDLTSEIKFRRMGTNFYVNIKMITSPVMISIPDFNGENCDIIHLKNIRNEMDADLFNKLKSEKYAIKTICLQVYNNNIDKIINRKPIVILSKRH